SFPTRRSSDLGLLHGRADQLPARRRRLEEEPVIADKGDDLVPDVDRILPEHLAGRDAAHAAQLVEDEIEEFPARSHTRLQRISDTRAKEPTYRRAPAPAARGGSDTRAAARLASWNRASRPQHLRHPRRLPPRGLDIAVDGDELDPGPGGRVAGGDENDPPRVAGAKDTISDAVEHLVEAEAELPVGVNDGERRARPVAGQAIDGGHGRRGAAPTAVALDPVQYRPIGVLAHQDRIEAAAAVVAEPLEERPEERGLVGDAADGLRGELGGRGPGEAARIADHVLLEDPFDDWRSIVGVGDPELRRRAHGDGRLPHGDEERERP